MGGRAPPPAAPLPAYRSGARSTRTNRWSREPTASHRCSTRTWPIAALTATGLGPQHCLGISRDIRMEKISGWVGESGDGDPVYARGYGCAGADTAHDAARNELGRRPAGRATRHHVEVMNWSAVAQAVHPRPQRGPEIPHRSRFPPPERTARRLSADRRDRPGRLLCSVGDHRRVLRHGSAHDEKHRSGQSRRPQTHRRRRVALRGWQARRRYHGTTHIVVAYLDRPEYVVGRDRWARYQSEVLHARLSLRTGARRPVGDGSTLDKVVNAIDGVAGVVRLTLQPKTAHERYGQKYRYLGR